MLGELTAYVDGKTPEMLAFLERLVNLDSGTYDKAGVDRVGAILADRLEALGFTIDRVPQIEYGDHLVARKQGSGERRLLFIGHMDTVFPTGTVAARPFRLADGRAYGPGVLDMKGGLTCLLYALEALKVTGDPAYEVVPMSAVLNSEEEALSPTSRPIIELEARRSHAACVYEPARPGGELVVARKGVGKYVLGVRGRASHAGSQPEWGRSAILELAHKIIALHALSEGGATVNVGVVRGGERSNIVPEFALAEVDVRATSNEEARRLNEEIRRIAAETTVPDTTAEVSGDLAFPVMERTPRSARMFEAVQAAGRSLGLELRGISTGGGSDGNHTSQYVPTIDGMGPKGSEAHSDREYIEVESLAERTKLTALFLASWPEVAGSV